MKKVISLCLLILIVFSISGCFKRDDLEDVTIYTTVYPLEYLTDELYGQNSKVLAVYPDGVDPTTYNLTEKQIKDYSKGAIFVYDGLSDEKKLAAKLINENKNLRIVDASQGITISNDVEELWLSPANYLMLAQNIKNQLKEYISNKYLKAEIDENYNTFKLAISEIDAELKIIAENAQSKVLVVGNNTFKFLEKYGFEVISLEGNVSASDLSKVKSLINDKKVAYIFIKEGEELNSTITDITNSYKVTLKGIKTITTLTDDERKNGEDYLTLMRQNVEAIKAEAYE